MNYFPFHVGDYSAHTAHLEPMEDLAYRRMLDVYYLREAPLPLDPSEIARLIRLRKSLSEINIVLEEFFIKSEDGWVNERCAEEIERMQDKQTKARESAAASVKSRKANAQRTHNGRSTDAQRTLNERSTDVELPTPTPTPTPTPDIEEEATPLLSADKNPPTQKPQAMPSPDLPTCQHRALIDLYHAKIPSLPRVRIELWEGQKMEAMRARWRWVLTAKRESGERYAATENEALAWFGKFFDAVEKSDFLTGRSGTWSANLAWLVKAENFSKVVQGSYENRSNK